MSNLPAAVRMMAGRPQQQQGGSAAKRSRLEMPFANAVTAQSFAAAVAAFPRPGLLPPGLLPAAVPLPTAPAVPGPMGRGARPRAVTSSGRMNPAANPAAVLPSAAAAAAAMLPPRDPAEVKQELTNHGCVIPKETTHRDLQLQLHDFEAHLKRAEKTKSIPRHPDPAIISCFKDGYSPGHEALVKMLESGIDPNTPSPGTGSGFAAGMTAILAAASWGKVDDIRLLIAAGADLKVRSPNIGHTVLHIAASASVDTGGVERIHAMLRMIIEADPELLASKNGMGKTPAEWAKHEKKRHHSAFLTSYVGGTYVPGRVDLAGTYHYLPEKEKNRV